MKYPDDFHNRIIHGDCCEAMFLMPDDSVDLVVTSPPYADKRLETYGGITPDKYAAWLSLISDNIMRVIKPTGSFVINVKEGANQGIRQRYLLDYLLRMIKGYRWVETYIWVKTNPYPTGSSRRLKDAFEYCYHFAKTDEFKLFPDNCLVKSESKYIESEKRRKNKGAHNVTNNSGMNMSKRYNPEYVRPSNVITLPTSCLNMKHSAAFPIELPEFFIKLMTEKYDIVYDPFMGSGSTAIACKRNSRTYIGTDKEAEYCQLAKDRLDKEPDIL